MSSIEPALDLAADLGIELVETRQLLEIAEKALKEVARGNRSEFSSDGIMAANKIVVAQHALNDMRDLRAKSKRPKA